MMDFTITDNAPKTPSVGEVLGIIGTGLLMTFVLPIALATAIKANVASGSIDKGLAPSETSIPVAVWDATPKPAPAVWDDFKNIEPVSREERNIAYDVAYLGGWSCVGFGCDSADIPLHQKRAIFKHRMERDAIYRYVEYSNESSDDPIEPSIRGRASLFLPYDSDYDWIHMQKNVRRTANDRMIEEFYNGKG